MKDIYTILSIIKPLKTSLYEGLLRGQQSTLDSGEETIYVLIEEFLKENYNGTWTISEKPNKDGLYEVNSDSHIPISVKNKQIISLVNGLFVWGTIKGNFSCSNCDGLKSLEGAPKIVEESFDCSYCKSLKSLEGAPEKVEGNFYCNDCEKLESLEGAPEKVEGNFYCRNCNGLKSLEGAPKEVVEGFNCSGWNSLKTLEGAPKEVGTYFDCSNCKSLKSLKGAPKEVGTYFDCHNCGKAFTADDIEKISKVNGNIYC